jgi:serine/threonine-protein kinase
VLVLAGAAGWWFLVRVPVHEVPDFSGQDVLAATAAAEELGWSVDASTLDRQDGTEPGEVLAQDPASGSSLAEGEVLRLTVSLGATLAAVPDVTGQPLDEARTAITDAGFVVASESRAFDEEVPVDAVISSTPVDVAPEADGRLPKGTAFDLVISDGPAPRVVPEGLQGARADDAEAALEAVQLEVVRSPSPSNEVPEGFVISVSEQPGTELARGEQVVLEVSSGPPPVPIPDVRFQSGAVAAAMLEADGFTVAGIEGSPSGMVLATDPPAGELHERGTAVRIFTRS